MASDEGPGLSSDRLVGFTLSLYFDPDGLGAWPSQETLATRTGYSKRAVGFSLERLCEEHWLDRMPRKSPRGNRHKRYGFEYRARLPRHLADAYAKGERRSLFNGKEPSSGRDLGVDSTSRSGVQPRKPARPRLNGERHDTSMANGVRTNTSDEYFTNGSHQERTNTGAPINSTESAKEVQKHRAARDEFVSDYERAQALEVKP